MGEGNYSNPVTGPDIRFEQLVCPPGSFCVGGLKYFCQKGYYGDKPMQTIRECSGLCDLGHFCPKGSVSPRQHKCGNSSFYCPVGSWEPTHVSNGYYTISTILVAGVVDQFIDHDAMTASGQLICEPGFYCVDGVKLPCPQVTWSTYLNHPDVSFALMKLF